MKQVRKRCVSRFMLYKLGLEGMFRKAAVINSDALILDNKQFKRFTRLKAKAERY